jgi:hypothetical protein
LLTANIWSAVRASIGAARVAERIFCSIQVVHTCLVALERLRRPQDVWWWWWWLWWRGMLRALVAGVARDTADTSNCCSREPRISCDLLHILVTDSSH